MLISELNALWELQDSGGSIQGVFVSNHGMSYYFFEDGIQIGAAYKLPAGSDQWLAFYPTGSREFTIRTSGVYLGTSYGCWEDAYAELWLRYIEPLAAARDIVKNCIDKHKT